MTLFDATERPRSGGLTARPAGATVIGVLSEAVRSRSGVERAFGVDPLPSDGRRLFAEIVAEQKLARHLAGLGSEWTVFNSLPIGGDDIDHLLIGRRGVFALLASPLRRGRAHGASPRAQRDALRASNLCRAYGAREAVAARLGVEVGHGVPVFAGVVLVGATRLRRIEGDGAPLLRRDEVARWLELHPRVLSDEEVRRIVAAAQIRSTWHFDESEPDDQRELSRSFERLTAEVSGAARRRIALGLLGAALALAVLLAGASTIVPSMLGGAL